MGSQQKKEVREPCIIPAQKMVGLHRYAATTVQVQRREISIFFIYPTHKHAVCI